MSDRGPNREILSVSQLNRSARQLLEGEFPMVFVEGEISNFSKPSSGHWYLTLKDDRAQLRCAMFVNRNRLIRFVPRNGLQVMVRGKISLYEGRGEFQLIVEHMEEAGDGALRRAFEALKRTLDDEGLFAAEHKQALPMLPKHIAVVTSPSGAAIRDVLHVLERRFPSIPVSVIPVQVQGEDSARQIVDALDLANRYNAEPFDVILLTRGGGSLEDLWSFNTEPVARAIFASRLPVVSAVGHETDVTIADFVADLRAPTPSAAAEILSPNAIDWLASVNRLERDLAGHALGKISRETNLLGHVTKRMRHPGRRLTDLHQRLDELEMRSRRAFGAYLDGFRLAEMEQRLSRASRQILERAGSRVRLSSSRLRNPASQIQQHVASAAHAQTRLRSAMAGALRHESQRLAAASGKLNAYSPNAILDRGYAIVMKGDQVIRSAGNVKAGERIVARLKEGEIVADVIETKPDQGTS